MPNIMLTRINTEGDCCNR